ncbi:MAG TPA: extracellular solute-binding protein [Clostridiaceae bacterium]|jgi:spermidine/putrescine-binding protein|nr:extracellular solute-binding protein [Clostridiaceae bacterium]
MDIYWEGIENINYIVPKEGSNLWFDCMVIPKTAKNKDAAEKFINFLLDPDNAYQNTEFVGYSTPNMEVVKRMKEENSEIIEMPAYWPSDEILERCEVFVDLGEALTIYNEVWTRVQAQ